MPDDSPRLMDDAALLIELEPEVARLYDRHAGMAQEWFPHDFIPYRLGRDFDKEPWTPDQPRLTGVAQTSFEVNLLTEDNLPSYHRLIHGMFGAGDGAWINWIGRWTAEEGRHAIVLRDYLTVTRNLDPVALERGRMTQLQAGYDRDTIDTLRGLAYVAFQELATRISHKNTGKYSQDPVADRIMSRIAADENLHMVFYRDILGAALKLDPSAAVQAIVAEVLAFEMPGAGIPGFLRKAATIAKAGIYDRHAKVAQEWFPHDYIPYRLGRDFDKEPWTPDQPRLSGVAQTSFEINLLTEDNLPSYHRLIHGMFGAGDGAWINWIGRWTAEEGRHAIVLRDYLTVTRNLDPVALERGRMTQLQQGYDHDAPGTLHGLAYVAFQELATRIAHRNTGRYSADPVADRIMVRIAADENLHMVFYRDMLSDAIKIDPSAAVRAIADEVIGFQ